MASASHLKSMKIVLSLIPLRNLQLDILLKIGQLMTFINSINLAYLLQTGELHKSYSASLNIYCKLLVKKTQNDVRLTIFLLFWAQAIILYFFKVLISNGNSKELITHFGANFVAKFQRAFSF